jgi:excisionase family DNA binding protein
LVTVAEGKFEFQGAFRNSDGIMTVPTLDAVHKNPASVAGLPREILTALLLACNAVSTTLTTALLTSTPVRTETTIDDPHRLLKADEVAEMLGTTPGVVYEMSRRGTIGHVSTGIVGNRAVRFTRQQVADFIKSREKAAVDSSAR